jgi:hypothetical protein
VPGRKGISPNKITTRDYLVTLAPPDPDGRIVVLAYDPARPNRKPFYHSVDASEFRELTAKEENDLASEVLNLAPVAAEFTRLRKHWESLLASAEASKRR